MENLEQVRARNALKFAHGIRQGTGDGKADAVVKKTATRIVQNGFLGALAFGLEKGDGPEDVFVAILYHVMQPEVKIMDPRVKSFAPIAQLDRSKDVRLPVIDQQSALEKFLEEISGKGFSALQLMRLTEEAMHFLSFLRRFTKD